MRLAEIQEAMASWYEIKVRALLGPEAGDAKEITILNRTVRWKDDEIEYEADSRHAEKIWEAMGLNEKSKGLDGPIVKDESGEGVEGGDEELAKDEATEFMGLAATANFLAQDRSDIYSVRRKRNVP